MAPVSHAQAERGLTELESLLATKFAIFIAFLEILATFSSNIYLFLT
jgi:hypothetical protein